MQNIFKSLAWAAAIIIATYFGKQGGMSDSALLAIITALSGTAIGTLGYGKTCSRSC